MLLWHDSLNYRSLTQLTFAYPTLSGCTVGGAHEQFGRTSVRMSGTSSLSLPVIPGVGTGSDTLYLGFRLGALLLPSGTGTLVMVRTAGFVDLVTVRVKSESGKLQFVISSGANNSLLVLSSPIDVLDTFSYIELKVKTSGSGSVELRINGVVDRTIDGVDTLLGSVASWSRVSFATESTSGTLLISDIYLADGTGSQNFLGPVDVTRLFPATAQQLGWAPALRAKKYLIVLAGQDNINGRGSVVPYSGPLNPNLKVWLYYPTTGAPYTGPFADVVAGIGAHALDEPVNPSISWALEMSLAEEISKLYELSNDTVRTEVYIVRIAKELSSIIPLPSPDVTWNPAIPGNLSSRAMQLLNSAATFAGGWSGFSHVDFFWYQGETEAIAASIYPEGITNFVNWTLDVFDYFETQIAKPINWHRMLVQTGLLPAYTHLHAVRSKQRSPLLPGSLIETDDLPIGPDQAHISEAGQITLGKRAFQSWVAAQDFAKDINEFYADFGESETLSPYWIGSNTLDSQTTFSQDPSQQLDLMHTPVLALNNKMRRESTSDGKLLDLTVGGIQMPSITLDSAAAWTFKYLQHSGPFLPEQVTGDISMRIS